MKNKIIICALGATLLLQGCQNNTEASSIIGSSNIQPQHIEVNNAKLNEVKNLTMKGEISLIYPYDSNLHHLYEVTGNKNNFGYFASKNVFQPFSVSNNGKTTYGFIDTINGNVIEPIYTQIHNYLYINKSTDLIPVKIGSKWGYIDLKGKIILEAKYNNAYPYNGEYAVVQLGNKYGVINKDGETILDFKYDSITDSMDGSFILESNNTYGFYYHTTKNIIRPTYIDLQTSNKGYTIAKKSNSCYDILTKNGDVIKTYSNNVFMVPITSENIESETYFIIYEDGKTSGADLLKDGEINSLVKPIYNSLSPNNGYLNYTKIVDSKYKYETGTIELDGKVNVTKYDMPNEDQPIVNGMKAYYSNSGFGYKDENSKIVISAKYNGGSDFTKSGFAIVYDLDEMILINKFGKELIRASVIVEVNNVDNTDISERYYLYGDKTFNSVSLYDSTENKTIAKGADNYSLMDEYYFWILDDNLIGLMDLSGNVLVKPREVFDFEEYKNGYLFELKNDLYFLTDLEGKKLHNTPYNYIGYVNEHEQRKVKIKYKEYIADKNANLLYNKGFNKVLTVNDKQFIGINIGKKESTISIINLNK